MATTYAALVSLLNVLNRFQHPTCPVTLDQSKIQSLFNKASCLVDFLEAFSEITSKDLERKMRDVAFEAEGTIESYYVDQIGQKSTSNEDEGLALLCLNIEKAIQEMDVIIQEAMALKDKSGEKKNQLPKCAVRGGLSAAHPSAKSKIVGLDVELVRLLERLTSNQTCRQVIPVSGMGGIGKTTLAKGVYNHPYVVHHFDIRLWVTISQDFTFGSIVRFLLSDMGIVDDMADFFDLEVDVDPNIEERLGEKLYKNLFGRKYVIVLDDIWSRKAWDEIRRFLPDNNNGSRVLLTTRLSTLAFDVGSCNPYEMNFLDGDKSWELLSHTVFGLESCNPRLEELGREIAISCKGLPLTIVVIGGLLKMSPRTRKTWSNVANNVNSIINTENDGQFAQVLSLSYNNLPIYLKPCFLYMAAFREDREVIVVDLIKLWVADGFLKPKKDRTLESVASEYLNDLIDRNLVMIAARDLSGRTKSCKVHDSLREFCLREAQNEKFISIFEMDKLSIPQRLFCHGSSSNDFRSMADVRSFVCYSSCRKHSHGARLLRVYQSSFRFQLHDDIRQLVNIRHLALKMSKLEFSMLLSSISLFWNLETLTVVGAVRMKLILPSAIWELPNLRHLVFIQAAAILPDPTVTQSNSVLVNLQTLHNIDHFNCTDEVLEKIPNLRELRAYYGLALDAPTLSRSFTNVAGLHKLEKMSLHFDLFQESSMCVCSELDNLTFSPNLRELELSGSKIPWESMTIFGSLPSLEVLILGQNAFCGEEWSPNEGEFQRLKFLLISGCYLKTWIAESNHFPRLQQLYLRSLELEEIPAGIGEAPSLELISFETNYVSIAMSAKEILDEQQDQGNDDLLVQGCCYGCPGEEEKTKLKNFTTYKFQVRFCCWDRVDDESSMEDEEHLAEDDYPYVSSEDDCVDVSSEDEQ